ncbi:MAG: hypothetical protein KF861_22780 [Planctomycetaceae bacterium]|nr:hypothetical protein [Planctomycetaceae bacterium]
MSDVNHLIQVKQALAEKYERLARNTRSKPKKQQFSHRAVKYRRQVAQMQHGTE